MTRRYVVVDPVRSALRAAIEVEMRREAARAKRRARRHRKRRDARKMLEIVVALAIRQEGKCAGPGCSVLLSESCTIDHVRPFAHGGSDKIGNLQLLCRRCNSKKGKRPMHEFQAASSD